MNMLDASSRSTRNVTAYISDISIGEAQHKKTPSEPILLSPPNEILTVNKSVIASFPCPGTKIAEAIKYGRSLWGTTAKLIVQLPSGEMKNYFLKAITLGATGRYMCEGEYESLKAIHKVSPDFVPEPYGWGTYASVEPATYFLLTEFRNIGEQPAEPAKLATRLADLHQKSVSPTGNFGFHVPTCHAKVAQAVDVWEGSWCTLYIRHLRHVMELAKPVFDWPEFDVVCRLILEIVVPRLLLPLQSEGRVLKPCLLHGDCWDENTALDSATGQPFVFDACSFYGHNEYDVGNWRAPRHILSSKVYMKDYKRKFPVSQPEEDWDARNLLYSLTFNICHTLYIPGPAPRHMIYDDMTTLCRMFCADELKRELKSIGSVGSEDEGASHENTDAEEKEEEEKRNEGPITAKFLKLK